MEASEAELLSAVEEYDTPRVTQLLARGADWKQGLQNMCTDISNTFSVDQVRLLVKLSGVKLINGRSVEDATKEELCSVLAEDLNVTRIHRKNPDDPIYEIDKVGNETEEEFVIRMFKEGDEGLRDINLINFNGLNFEPYVGELSKMESPRGYIFDLLGIIYKIGAGVSPNKDEAINWFNKSGDKGFYWGAINAGDLLNGKGQYRQAIDQFDKALQSSNLSTGTRINIILKIGDSYFSIKNLDKALEYYKEALKLGSTQAKYNIAVVYYDLHQDEEMMKYLVDFMVAEPNDVNALILMGSSYIFGLGAKRDLDKAEECFLKANEKINVSALESLGYVYNAKFEITGDEKYRELSVKNYLMSLEYVGGNPDVRERIQKMDPHGYYQKIVALRKEHEELEEAYSHLYYSPEPGPGYTESIHHFITLQKS